MTSNCAKWHSQPLVNPVTNRKIKVGGPKYKELEQKCGPPPSRQSRRSPSPSRQSRRSPSPSRQSRRSPPPSRQSRRSPSPSRRSRRSPSPSRQSRRSPSPSRRPTEIYCGNNARDEGLINGTKILGTRYQCLKKGIGRGLHEPILSYTNDYSPIEEVKIFCGNGNVLPQNKDRFGTRDECLRKGFAVGQNQKYTRDGDIQRTPVVSEDKGWYKVYLPSALGAPILRR
ncbi:hypothetical protein IIV30_146R [Invertebrate iridescent virus 30]|uniref:2-cysteine adaptor domain-containing protein n=1 Tax=Invertebrate iridescent virus 30 TaxID=345585 RepID=W8W275_9VIRU|nr:hypothetical protein IIV30_146R [Invertebrate iridescent virus 30]CCV02341.1 hypothetical protein IIV30_146R [Invertebrate iridescent virus 30]